jgi:hypothetical protein
VKAKKGAVCVLEKGRKEEILIKVMGAIIWAKLSPSKALAGQKDRTRSNWCIKERN